MTMSQEQLTERLRLFTAASLKWCAIESEQATGRVSQTVGLLLDNATRVTAISQESLKVLQGLRKAIEQQTFDKKKAPAAELIKSLVTLTSEHEETNSLIGPIIESLQFQDRMRQNFDNMSRMLEVWAQQRQAFGAKPASEEDLQNFGKALMQVTTMASEREVVRRHISGLEPEAAIAPVLLF